MSTETTTPGEAELRESFTFADGGVTYPFVEDENCNITGYGHHDKAQFAAAVARYDVAVGGVSAQHVEWDESEVAHRWAVIDPADVEVIRTKIDGEPVFPTTPGAFPITTMWGVR